MLFLYFFCYYKFLHNWIIISIIIIYLYYFFINFFFLTFCDVLGCSAMFRILLTADQRVLVNFDFIPSRSMPKNKIILCW